MAQSIVIAKNQTGGSITLEQLALTIPASPGSGTLTDFNTLNEIQDDVQLKAEITSGNILLNDGTTDLTLEESLNFASTLTALGDPDKIIEIQNDGSTVVHGVTRLNLQFPLSASVDGTVTGSIQLDFDSSVLTASGPAGGDLTGTYPNPEVAAITDLSGTGTRFPIGDLSEGDLLVISGGEVIGVPSASFSGSGESNTASNVGTGEGVFQNKVGVDLRFRSILAGEGMQVISGTNEITVEFTGSGRMDYGTSSTDPTSPAPTGGDIYYNTVLDMEMRYDVARGKWLSVEAPIFKFSRNGNTAVGSFYRSTDGNTFTPTDGIATDNSGTVIAMAITRDDTDAAVFEVTEGGSQIAFMSSSAILTTDNSLDGDFDAGSVLGARNASTDSNTTSDVHGWFKVKWRI